MADTQTTNQINTVVYHHYQTPQDVCTWIFNQVSELFDRANLLINQYREKYSSLALSNGDVCRYPLGIKVDEMTNDNFSIRWGLGNWNGKEFVMTKMFSLQDNRFRTYYLEVLLAEAPIELKALVSETEDQCVRIRKLQYKIIKLIGQIIEYESESSSEKNVVTRSILKSRCVDSALINDHSQLANRFYEWIVAQNEILHKEAEYYVSYYWGNNRKNYGQEKTSIALGLRIKKNRSNSISIEWFEAKFIGKKVLENKRFKKPKNIHHYANLEKVIVAEPKWFIDLVMLTEEELMRIRKMMFTLSTIKEAFLEYQSI
ncbi:MULTISPECIES: conjugative transfer protein MobI(A/C) [Methylomonas]|nr:conjugative transfer protein MobI(A/C) [Methylomonas koyamae]